MNIFSGKYFSLVCIGLLSFTGSFSILAEDGLPYQIKNLVLTLKNDKGEETLTFNPGESVTIQFTDLKPQKNNSKVEFSLANFSGSENFLNKQKMQEVENPDGSYTYYYTFDIKKTLKDVPDWYYFIVESKTPKNDIRGHIIVDGGSHSHHFKIFNDPGFSKESNEFGLNDTLYIEVVGEDNGKEFSTKKVQITDNEKQKYINNNISMIEQIGNLFRFSVDLTQAKKTFDIDQWYTLEVDIDQKQNKFKSFIGYREIKILTKSQKSEKKWTQFKWREVK